MSDDAGNPDEHGQASVRRASVCQPFADALKKHRVQFNEAFHQQSHLAGGVDGAAFLQHLHDCVDPIVASVAEVMPECADQTAIQLYNLSLDLFAQRVLGQSGSDIVGDTWHGLIPLLPGIVARDSAHVVGTVSNVALNMARQPCADESVWLDKMIELAPAIESKSILLEICLVLAWRYGMVQYREPAIEAASAWDEKLVQAVLKLPEGLSTDQIGELLGNLRANCWSDLESQPWEEKVDSRRIEIVAKVGAFRGFDGQFVQPPKVGSVDGSIVASDTESNWQVFADRYGAMLHRISPGIVEEKPLLGEEIQKAFVGEGGVVSWNGLQQSFPELVSASSWAATEETLAVTLADSHHVYLLAIV